MDRRQLSGQAVSLRSVADGNFVVVDKHRRPADDLVRGGLFGRRADPVRRRDPHGAVARPTRSNGWTGRAARPTSPAPTWTTTPTHRLHQVEGAGTLRRVATPAAATASHGEVHVVRRVAGYKKIRYYTHENIGYGPVNLPDQELHTTAVWWQLPQAVLLKAFASQAGRARWFPRRGLCAARRGHGGGDGRCARPAEVGRQWRRRVVRHARTARAMDGCRTMTARRCR